MALIKFGMMKCCRSVRSLMLLLVTVTATSLFGCGETYPVQDRSETVRSQAILERGTEYGALPVWLSENQIVLPFSGGPNFEGAMLYDLETNELKNLIPDLGLGCYQGSFGNWARLPDGRLGFLYECRDNDLLLIGRYLMAWDSELDRYEEILFYADTPFPLGAPVTFAISSDYAHLIQEANGGGIFHRLYWVSLDDGEIEQLFPEYYRAASPSWSPDEEHFVFAGNDSGPRRLTGLFSGYQSLSNEISKPWDLYLATADGNEVQKVLSDIRSIDTVKWSPKDENAIAFRGEYELRRGLWLFELDTESLTFLWPENRTRQIVFDWSPDGERIILFDCEEHEETVLLAYCQPTILWVPNK